MNILRYTKLEMPQKWQKILKKTSLLEGWMDTVENYVNNLILDRDYFQYFAHVKLFLKRCTKRISAMK